MLTLRNLKAHPELKSYLISAFKLLFRKPATSTREPNRGAPGP